MKDALAGTDVDAVRRGHEELINASQEFSQRLYAAASAATSAGGDGEGAASAAEAADDDEVAEAEIVDEPGEAAGA